MAGTSEVAVRASRKSIEERIERLAAPADVKAALAAMVDISVEIGGKIIEVGRRILAFIFDFARSYPNLTVGLVAALVLSHLIASIPGIGPILSPVLTLLLLIVGVGLGAMRDLADGSMRIELSGLEAYFRDLGVA